MERRKFFKSVAGSVFLPLLPPRSQAETQSSAYFNVNEDLKFLDRGESLWPLEAKGYRSSYYKIIFRFVNYDPESGVSVFAVQPVDEKLQPNSEEFLCHFSVHKKNETLIFLSLDKKYAFLWKRFFGLYILDSKKPTRIVEHCEPLDGHKNRYLSDNSITRPLGRREAFYSHWVRWSYWMNGGVRSPLRGFEGFAEESLSLDISDQRDQKVAVGLDWFLNSIPFGLPALKLLAKTSPLKAIKLCEKLIPKVFGWMIGPTQIVESGKIVLSDCPYRKRLGTQVCESTCGHSIGKYFTENVGIPMKFDPTVDGYSKCHILIGKKQVHN